MNIVVKSDYLSRSALFGIERATYMMLKALFKCYNKDKYDVKLYLTGMENKNNLKRLPFKYYLLPFNGIGRLNILMKKYHVEGLYRYLRFGKYIYHINCNYGYVLPGEKFILTVHDIIEYQRSQDESFRRMYSRIIENSLAIAADSESTKNDIINNFNVDPNKITVIYLGCDRDTWYIDDTKKVASFLKNLSINGAGSYFLSVSCADIRKNVATLLESFDIYTRKGGKYDLVLLWKNPPQGLLERYSNLIAKGRVRFLGVVSDDELRLLYNGALATFFISLYEGFGFPILESQACGTPVVTCQNSSLPEVGKDSVLYVGEHDVDGIANTMLAFDNNTIDRERYVQLGLDNIKGFEWDLVGEKYNEFYSSVIDSLE